MTLTEYEKGWLEAALDGEGCLFLSKRHSRGQRCERQYMERGAGLVIANTNKEFCEYAKELFGAGYIAVRKTSTGRIYYQFYASRNALREVLPQLQLIVKEEQRQIILQTLEILWERKHNHYYPERDNVALDVLADTVHELNCPVVNREV